MLITPTIQTIEQRLLFVLTCNDLPWLQVQYQFAITGHSVQGRDKARTFSNEV